MIRCSTVSPRSLNQDNRGYGVKIYRLIHIPVSWFIAATICCFAQGQEKQDKITIDGTVSYQPKMGLPEGSVLRLAVTDESTRESIWREEFKIEHGQNPIHFAISILTAKIEQGHSYQIDSEISIKGRSWYRGSVKLPRDVRESIKNLDIMVRPIR